MEKYMHVREGAELIRSQCDGAVTEDGIGFNKIDRPFVDSVLSKQMTSKMVNALKKTLIKYKRQYEKFGVDPNLFDITPERMNGDNGYMHQIQLRNSNSVEIRLEFTFDFNELKTVIKPFCWFNSTDKSWVVKEGCYTELRKELLNYKKRFDVEKGVKEVFQSKIAEETEAIRRAEMSDKADTNFQGFKFDMDKLYPFQRAGIEYALSLDNVLFADQPGLGKTVQSIVTVEEKEVFPCLVICPASLKINWQREIKKWTGKNSIILDGDEYDTDYVIINYDVLKKWFIDVKNYKGRKLFRINKFFESFGFKSMIVDESTYCKSRKAIRTKATKIISKHIKYKILLTGTPILNRPKELVEQLDILGVLNKFGGGWNFLMRYCDGKKGYWGWDFDGSSNLEELNEKLKQNCMVRRKKEDVLKELPDKSYNTLFFEMKNKKRYFDAEKDLINWFKERYEGNELRDKKIKSERAEQLVKINALRQIATEEKMDSVIEWIENFIESDEKLVVFCHHKKFIYMLKEYFNGCCVTLSGDNSKEERQQTVDQFQTNNNIKLFIGSIKASGMGLTLTAASSVAFIELPWTPAELSQAEDRCHRIGQEENVMIYYFLTEKTIEESIANLLDQKRKVSDILVDGKVSNIVNDIITNFM